LKPAAYDGRYWAGRTERRPPAESLHSVLETAPTGCPEGFVHKYALNARSQNLIGGKFMLPSGVTESKGIEQQFCLINLY